MRVSNFDVRNQREKELLMELMETSFPQEERPSWERWLGRFQKTDNFKVELIWDEDRFVGFMTYWIFNKFVYAEHFAVSPEVRGGGWGGMILTHILNSLDKPILLEVELPTTVDAQRRIRFYERFQLQILNHPYRQPAYEEGYPEIDMYLMSNHKEEMEALVDEAIKELKAVYGKI